MPAKIRKALWSEHWPKLCLPSRQESGCLEVQAYRATGDPRLFYIHSRWKDETDFDRHATLPHTVKFIQTVEPLLDHLFEVTRDGHRLIGQ